MPYSYSIAGAIVIYISLKILYKEEDKVKSIIVYYNHKIPAKVNNTTDILLIIYIVTILFSPLLLI